MATTAPNSTKQAQPARFVPPTTIRLNTDDRARISDLLAELQHRTGRTHTFSALIRELIRTEHAERCESQ